MRKGQGAPKRSTIWEAMYGPAASSKEVQDHLTIISEHDRAIFGLHALERNSKEKEWKLLKRQIEPQRQKVRELKARLIDSWQKIWRSPGALRAIAEIAEQKRDQRGFAYPVDEIVLRFYRAGERYQPLLLAVAQLKNPNFSASDFSELIEHYKLKGLKKGRAGRKPKNPDLAEEFEQLRFSALKRMQVDERRLKKVREKLAAQIERKYVEQNERSSNSCQTFPSVGELFFGRGGPS